MKIRLLLASLLFVTAAGAQVFSSTYDFAGVSSSSGLTDPSAVPVATGVTFGSFHAVVTTANPNATGRFSFTAWPLGATNGSNTFTGTIDLNKYYEVTIAPQNNFSLDLSSISFTLQRSGTGVRQYAVRSSFDSYAANLPASIDPANAQLQVVSSNVFQVDDAASTAMDGSTITLTGFSNLTAPVSFRFYAFNAESNAGTFSIDNVKVSGEALPLMGAPVITLNKSSFLFPSTNVNMSAPVQTYTVNAVNLMADVAIATTGPFSISTDNSIFATTLSLTPAQLTAPFTVYVKFNPTTAGSFAGTITHNSGTATQKNISLAGEGINLNTYSFDFNTCTDMNVPGSGFISYSTIGAQVWTCTTFGRNFTNGVNMNGYFGGSLNNEDWLISPSFNLAGFSNLPVLSFYSRAEFTGPPLELLVSTNYDGFSDPNSATWTALNGDFPSVGSNVWTASDNINLSAYKSFPNVYIAFKYTSSPVAGAPRWSIDDVSITDKTQLFTTNPYYNLVDLGEAGVGASSVGKPITLQSVGYGDVTVTAPSDFQVSADNISYGGSIIIPTATAAAGTTFYVRFTPLVKSLKITGQLNFSGTGLNSTRIPLAASSYLRSETFDVVTYNMKFFGAGPTGAVPLSQQQAQKVNISTVIQHLNADVIGFQEESNDSLFNKMMELLPGYDKKISNRWSSFFLPPDPTFPPQKVGFIYKTATMQFVSERVMFANMYDSARAGFNTIPNYPTGSASNFWSSGRMPYMVTFNTTINGITKQIRMVSIHAKSGSGATIDYQRRVYDAKVLKDSLDLYYATDSVIVVGDYNDPLLVSEFGTGMVSPYKIFVDDPDHYEGVTLPLEKAGRPTYIGSTNGSPIDHHIITNELKQYYIPNSMDIEDPRNYIPNYSSTTSDHLPVYARYDFTNGALPVTITKINAILTGKMVLVNWTTATEINSSHFVIERSVDGVHFESLGQVAGAGNSVGVRNYQFTDLLPAQGYNYYRIKLVDIDNRFAYTPIAKVLVSNGEKILVRLYPNPVTSSVQVSFGTADIFASNWQLIGGDGKILLQGKGNAATINSAINTTLHQLYPGMYLLKTVIDGKSYTSKFIKE
ncbi:MAG: choice-of-anchor J domain-containing protein [Chitinophagaceae bacterium]